MEAGNQISLREFLIAKIEELKLYFDVRFNASEKAKELAYATLEKRLEAMNEFRDTLKDQAGNFITRKEVEVNLDLINKEVEAHVDRIDAAIKNLELSKAMLEGKASQSSMNLTMVIALSGLVIGLVGIILNIIK
jgi:uncharacterized membrane protein